MGGNGSSWMVVLDRCWLLLGFSRWSFVVLASLNVVVGRFRAL